MKKLSLKLTTAFVVTLFLNTACANASKTDFDQSKFRGWLAEVAKEAESEGISDVSIYNFLKNAEFIPKVIELDQKQPDKIKTFEQYVNIVIPDYKIKRAQEKLKENKKLLIEVSKKYGVQPRFIVALWAIESDFGNNMGSFNVINSLASLAYDGRRGEFFKKELFNALKILDEGHIDYSEMKGSWAGAMGQTQFMPSSFLELAVDYNNDGKRDIWESKEDVFGSIANYLSKRGWDERTTWGRKVKLPKHFNKSLIGKDIEKTLKEWQKLGVRKENGGNLPGRDDVKASLVRPEDDKDNTYLIYSNYKTVLKWNRSLYFATAVGILSDGIDN